MEVTAPGDVNARDERVSMFRDIAKLCVRRDDPVRKAISCIDVGSCGIALVIDDAGRLIATITDGDIRRAILAQQDMEASIEVFLACKKPTSSYSPPVTAAIGTDPVALLALMTAKAVRQIPLLDARGCVADLAVIEDLVPIAAPAMRAVIMAGGLGTRLSPLTDELPKPMLSVGGQPVMEHTIEQLRRAGIRHVNISTHYKPEKIIEHFGDGQAFGVYLNYVNEDRPLGTAGALGLIPPPAETQLVINGDVLTQLDFRAMLVFHQDNRAEMTVAVKQYKIQVPYGVIECNGTRVSCVREKPKMEFFVNAGVYLLEPAVFTFIPRGQSFNMTDLIQGLLNARRAVISFPIREYWLDIGQHSDYAQAEDDIKKGRAGG